MRRFVALIMSMTSSIVSMQAYALDVIKQWQSPATNRTWTLFNLDNPTSLKQASALCLEAGLALPSTEAAEVEIDLFSFLSTNVPDGTPGVEEFTFRDVPVRFFPLVNQHRKQERYDSTAQQDRELTHYFSSLYRVCRLQGDSSCMANCNKWLKHFNEKAVRQTKIIREIGYRIVFVDVMGQESNLEPLDNEYPNFRTVKPSYETARTVLEFNDEAIRWSGLICVSP